MKQQIAQQPPLLTRKAAMSLNSPKSKCFMFIFPMTYWPCKSFTLSLTMIKGDVKLKLHGHK